MGKCLINGTNNNGMNAVAVQVINFFIDKGFTPKQACAIAGNVFKESSYVANSGPHKDCSTKTNKCGPSFGLFMFHDSPCNNGGTSQSPNIPCTDNGVQKKCCGLFSEMVKWCQSHGYDYKTARGQLEFVWSGQGQNSNFQTVFKDKTNESMESLVSWWANNWEHCGKCDIPARLAEANRLAGLYNQMNKGECNIDMDEVGSSESSGYSCNTEQVVDSSSTDVSVSDSSSASSADSNGNTGTQANAINTKPLFVGDTYAGKIYASTPTLKNKTTLLSGNWNLPQIANKIKAYLSNGKNKPKSIIVYCGDDHKFTDYAQSMLYISSSRKLIKDGCKAIINACNGYTLYFSCNYSEWMQISGCNTDFGYTAACQINHELQALKNENWQFRLIPKTTVGEEYIRGCVQCVGGNKSTLTSKGFTYVGTYIRVCANI